MNEKVAQALSHVDERYISEAARRKKRKTGFLAAVAAILAVMLFWRTPSIPLSISANAVSLASPSRKTERPDIRSEEFDAWYEERMDREETVSNSMDAVLNFSRACSEQVLTGVDSTNRLWSPINAYIALSMTAELTGGSTRQDLLELLGASRLEELRIWVSAIWEKIYQDDGWEISILANSLWLDDEIQYNQDVMDTISHSYYASVYQGDLGSRRTNKDITDWLNNQTGGFLKDRSGTVELEPEAVLAIASTIYFQSQWDDQFDSGNNSDGLFHAVSGDVDCTFMNAKEREMHYYWAQDYGAVQLHLENGCTMWLILPDEDKTVDDVLLSGEYMTMISRSGLSEENQKWMKVNLSVPKFDVSASMDLKQGLQNMGLTSIFEPLGNDFSPSINSEIPVYLSSVNQDTRVSIDEEGVTAASHIVIEGAGAAAPPDEIIDFVLDRPFVFAIACDGIPLFLGTVNVP